MIDFLKQLPHLEPYGNPFYFIYLGIALLPIFIGLFFKKRFAIYECLVSITFIVLALTGTHASQILALLSILSGKSSGYTHTNVIVVKGIINGSSICTRFLLFFP